MDKSYIEKTENFIAQLEKEKTYIEFLNYKTIIEKDEELKANLDKYMKKRFELQANKIYGSYNSYYNLLELQREYEDLLSEPLVQKYLKAELDLSKLMKDVFNIMSENIELDLAFL